MRRQMLVERLHDRGAGSQIIYTFLHYLIVLFKPHSYSIFLYLYIFLVLLRFIIIALCNSA